MKKNVLNDDEIQHSRKNKTKKKIFSRLQTVVLLHTWIAGLEDSNFSNASKWMPDRWIKSTSPHSPLLVAPFGAGRRICPGKRFVEQALQLIVAKVNLFSYYLINF